MKTAIACLLILVSSGAAAQVNLFGSPGSKAATSGAAASTAHSPARRHVALDAASIHQMKAGDEAVITTPGSVTYRLVYERTETGYGGGKVWVGHMRDFGKNYPVLISTYAGHVNGSIFTPKGKLSLQGTEQQSVLTDMQAANERTPVPTEDDALPVPRSTGSVAADSGRPKKAVGMSGQSIPSAVTKAVTPGSPATAANPAEIEVMILYTAEFQAQFGGDAGAIARLNLLVATANTAYTNSGIFAYLRVVHTEVVNYNYDNVASLSTVLGDFQSDPTVAALRNTYAADVAILARPFTTAGGGECGVAYLPSSYTVPGASSYAYALVEDGTVSTGPNSSATCDVSTLTHEVGHLMGATHDVAADLQFGSNVNGGTPTYNRGYCNGNAGTVMSYTIAANGCSPLALYFSNPALSTCGGGSCGVPIGTSFTVSGTTVTGADSTTAINTNAPYMARYEIDPDDAQEDQGIDLAITKTDNQTSYVPGVPITYTIVVTNAGPALAVGFSIADAVPAVITGVNVTCVATGAGNSCGTNASTGNAVSFNGATTLNPGAGNDLTLTITGTVGANATGNLTNTATVTAAAGAIETNLANNSATDTDTQAAAQTQVDLAIVVVGPQTATPGGGIQYTLTVSNAGPSDASGIDVSDAVPNTIVVSNVNCVAAGAGSCGTNASAGNNVSYTGAALAAGAGNTLTITISGTVSATATGTLANTASVSAGAGAVDVSPGNNSATTTAALTPTQPPPPTGTTAVPFLNWGALLGLVVLLSNLGFAVMSSGRKRN